MRLVKNKLEWLSLMFAGVMLFSAVSVSAQEMLVLDDQIQLENGELLPEPSTNYTLGEKDVIEINVLRHPEVSGKYVINNEGNIQYEFVGDIPVTNLTKKQVTEKIVTELEKFIIAPEVTVKIVGYNSKVVYVIGEVGRPGKISIRGDSITVREALVQAGLPTLSAKTSSSLLITPSENGKPEQIKVNVKKLLFAGDLRENHLMKPGDMLYVPPTAMAKALRVIQPVTAPITNATGGARAVTTGF